MRRSAAALALALLLPARAPAAGNDARDLLRDADRARGNLDGVAWEVTVRSVGEGGRTTAMTLAVQARGFDVLAETLAPPKSRGDRILLREGGMWFHRPGLSRPVPVSQRQRLLGEAAYGDVAATNYAEDYDLAGRADEAVGGEACIRLDLSARAGKGTYERIRYWVSRERRVAVRAEYAAASGKVVKTAAFEHANAVPGEGGRPRPFISRMVIEDALLRGRTTTLEFARPVLRAVPPRVFDLNLLGR